MEEDGTLPIFATPRRPVEGYPGKECIGELGMRPRNVREGGVPRFQRLPLTAGIRVRLDAVSSPAGVFFFT